MSDKNEGRPWVNPKEPHWIVVRLSRGDEPKKKPENRLYFRHPTEGAANAEADRLAKLFPGRRFRVYSAGQSFKVEEPASVG